MSLNKVWIFNTDKNDKNLYKLIDIENIENLDTYEYYTEYDNHNVENLVYLTYVNIPTIMNVLNLRYIDNQIYTYNGDILISINPFKLVDIYTNYAKWNIDIPHVYSLAEKSYRNINRKNQSILVSGESGSGKTENTKYILDYLCKNYSKNENLGNNIINSNYIIELFGNAQTMRNDNSSRFGKFIKLYIKNNFIVGGHIENYLLEKSRISKINDNERTYHIFYLLCNNNHILKKYGFKDTSSYKLLKNSNCNYTINEFTNLDKLINIFHQFNFTETDIDTIFCKIRLILELSNCENKKDLEKLLLNMAFILDKLDINQQILVETLTVKVYNINNEEITKKFNNDEILVNIKTYSEDLYEELFSYIISQISYQLGDVTDKYISILDIFGFEIFDHNGYEQLCINYTNEVLQQIFNQYIFKNEQIEYKKEQIDWEYIEYEKNDDIIEIFNGNPSIFSIINEQSILGSGTDKLIYSNIETILNNDIVSIKDISRKDRSFFVTHFTGNVEYKVNDFILKNRINNKSNKIKTNLQYFTHQLSQLKDELDQNQCYFIRCIKPNNENKPNVFDQKKIYTQLLYSGIIEGIKIVLKGYPVKKNKEQCVDEFKFLSYFENCNILEYLAEKNISKQEYQLGNKKIFMKAELYDKLNKKNIRCKVELAIYIQKYARRLLCRKKYFYHLYFIQVIQTNIRMFIAKRKVNKIRIYWNASIINSRIRTYIAQLNFQKQRSQLTISKNYRAYKAYKNYKQHKSSIIISKCLLGYTKRKQYLEILDNKKNNAALIIILWLRRIIFNSKVLKRSLIYKLQTEIKNYKLVLDNKNNEIKKINNIMKSQSDEITRLNLLISKMEMSSDNLNNFIEYEMESVKKNINDTDIKIFSDNLGQVVNDLYDVPLSSDSDIDLSLNEGDVKLIKQHKLEELGGKMERLYTELHDSKQMVQLMQTQYRVLLKAYQDEVDKKNYWSGWTNFFGNSK